MENRGVCSQVSHDTAGKWTHYGRHQRHLVTLIWATQGSQAVTSAHGVVHECCGSDLNREVLFIPGVYKLEVSPGTQYNMHSCYPRI